MRTLEISKDFTLDDIRKIRDYSYYRRNEIGNEAYEKEARDDYLKGMAMLNRIKCQKARLGNHD
ncbi:hypothetical protein FACS1894187_21350 [Synergistales bacterium]|nr:hypothetical protein FACS1894187_21350 [Synergistales bacterium]